MRGGNMAKLALLGGLAFAGISGAAPAQAQGLKGAMQHFFHHEKAPAGSKCPGVSVLMHSTPTAADISGYLLFDNSQGVSVIAGTRQPDGSFKGTLTNLDGQGPVGTFKGRRLKNGQLNAVLDITGCSPVTINSMSPVQSHEGT